MAKSEIDHGRCGRIRVVSEMNPDREPPSRQVWVEMWYQGKLVGTSSGNLVEDMRLVELDRHAPAGAKGELLQVEIKFLEPIMEQFEGRKD